MQLSTLVIGLAVIFLFVLLWAISSELNRIRLSINHLTYRMEDAVESLKEALIEANTLYDDEPFDPVDE